MIYTFIAALFVVPLLIYVLFRVAEFKLIYEPSRLDAGDPSSVGLSFEDAWMETGNGRRIHGWWFEKKEARGTIIHCHGNADNITQRLWFAEQVNKLPVNVLMYDYQGYGKSEGRPGLQATRHDGIAAYDFVMGKQQEGEECLPIIVIGQSLGGATAIELASKREVQGLIIESTFTSIKLMGRRFYPFLLPGVFTTITYDSLAKVPHLHMPKLFAHSRDDRKIPFDMGRELYEAAAEPKQWVELQGGHGEESFKQTQGYFELVEKFVMTVVNKPS